jgi:predicted RND superfamily exporter protein
MKTKKDPFVRAGLLVSRHPLLVVLVFALLVLSSLLASLRIVVKTQVKDLLPADNPQAVSYTEIVDNFRTASILLITVEGPEREAVIAAAEALAESLRADPALTPLIKSVNLKIERDFLARWGLLLSDTEDLLDNEKLFADMRLLPLFRQLNDQLEEALWGENAEQEIDSSREEEEAAAMMSRLELFLLQFALALRSDSPAEAQEKAVMMAEHFLFGERYTMSPEGTFLVFSVTPRFNLMDRRSLVQLSDGVRGHLNEAGVRFPALRFGATGDVAQEADEERALSADALYPALVAFFLIVVLFLFSFTDKRSVAFAAVCLAAGILLDLGISALVIGELNMMTSSFGALLLGLGIDFGLHVVVKHDELRLSGASARRSVRRLLADVGLPVSLGALTTALAFYALLFSRTKGFRQFGFVAGTGVLTTLLAMLLLLPALLALFPGRPGRRPRRRLSYEFLGTLGLAVMKSRLLILGVLLVLAAASLFTLGRNSFEYDMRRIGPQGTEAKQTEERLLQALDLSSYTSLVLYRDMERARKMTERLEEAAHAGRVESVTRFVPAEDEQRARLAIIRRLHEQKRAGDDFAWDAERLRALAEEIQRLEYNIIEFGDLSATVLGEDNDVLRKRHAMIRELYGAEVVRPGKEVFRNLIRALSDDPRQRLERISGIDRAFSRQSDRIIREMTAVEGPITPDDLPEDLRSMFVSDDGRAFLVIVYPDRKVSDEKTLLQFSEALWEIEPRVTGALQLGIALSREILTEALRAVLLVSGVILVILLLSFRNVGHTLLCLASLVLGMTLMLGAYPLLGKLNVINMLAFPLIIGIGIDYSIHLLHRYREGLALAEILRVTGKAILLSGLTTMFGFGSLALAGRFAGVASLGTLLFVGTTACLAVALLLQPAVLSLLGKSTIPVSRSQE